jgi:polyhydroxyalkanoate synthesis regulator phasin
MTKKRRAFEVFTLSFLDCICCGFGAVVLFYTIVQAHVGAQEIIRIDQLTGEVSKLEEEVKEGMKNLVVLRNTLEKTDEDAAAARARAIRVAAELKERREQSTVYDEESLARRAHINQLKADIKSLEEGVKRLQGGALDKAPAGERVKSFRGRGNRKYISALQMKGKRILVLLDTSASMMDEDVVKVMKLRNQPEPMRRAALKWRRALDIVEWVSAQLPDNSQFQVIGFNTKAKVVQASTNGQWLDSNDPRVINGVLQAARGITPGDGTSLVNAFLAIRTLTPQPDQIILITDGLPTQGSVPPLRKFISSRDREKLFEDAAKTLEKDTPMDIVMLPMKGDPLATHAYWRLARRTKGSYVIPSRDWP